MGELHIRIAAQRLRRFYDVEVELKTPKVPYRETITRRVENVEGKLKKQTGGKGMYGVCYLSVEPLPRGAGVEFVDEIVGGSIPRNLIPAVEKGVLEAAAARAAGGLPGRGRPRALHRRQVPPGRLERDGLQAGRLLRLQGRDRAGQADPARADHERRGHASPTSSVGDIMGDISRPPRPGPGHGIARHGQVIKAEVPMAEMLEYASALTSLTGGKGAFHMEFSHYDEVPAYERDKIIAEAKAAAAGRGRPPGASEDAPAPTHEGRGGKAALSEPQKIRLTLSPQAETLRPRDAPVEVRRLAASRRAAAPAGRARDRAVRARARRRRAR